MDFSAEITQIFARCHRLRNVAEYEGHLEIGEVFLSEFIEHSNELLKIVESLEALE